MVAGGEHWDVSELIGDHSALPPRGRWLAEGITEGVMQCHGRPIARRCDAAKLVAHATALIQSRVFVNALSAHGTKAQTRCR